jgi:mono/diheme cytochrome c family protein
MKRFKKVLAISAVVLAAFLIVAITLTIGWRPFLGPRARPLTARQFEATPQRLARGKYLVNGLTGCLMCHSERDWNAPGAPPLNAKLGAGGFFRENVFPGQVVVPNLTADKETGAGNWTDDQLARSIREGIASDGRTLFPLMPYGHFRALADEDLAAIIVYIRALAPVHNALPQTEIDFPVKYLIRSAPEPVTAPVPEVDSADVVKRGEYLVRMASCESCHTPQKRGQGDKSMAFAGGLTFTTPFGIVASNNITPDSSGIPYYDEKLFLEVMRTGRVRGRVLNSIMPWVAYRNLSDEDLTAMFAYLRSVKPVQHRIDNTEAATFCKRCQGMHGAGDQN